MIAALLGLDLLVVEAGAILLIATRRAQMVIAAPSELPVIDEDAEARTVILPAVDLDGVDRVRPYVKYLPPWIDPSAGLDPWLRRDLIMGYSVANMLAVRRQLALEGGAL